jgi:hypothetical protein
MLKAIGVASLLTWVLSVVVHLLTFVPGVSIAVAYVWPLHLLCMFCFASMVVVYVRSMRRAQAKSHDGMYSRWKESQRAASEIHADMARVTPSWLRLLLGASFAYALVNFALFLRLSEGGNAQAEDGKYVLSNHGKTIRPLTSDEYHRMRAYEVRGFSGHWMLFSLAPAVYFLVTRPRLQDAVDGPTNKGPSPN